MKYERRYVDVANGTESIWHFDTNIHPYNPISVEHKYVKTWTDYYKAPKEKRKKVVEDV